MTAEAKLYCSNNHYQVPLFTVVTVEAEVYYSNNHYQVPLFTVVTVEAEVYYLITTIIS